MGKNYRLLANNAMAYIRVRHKQFAFDQKNCVHSMNWAK